MKNNLPVFPLGLVALPGSIQSLQIFEPRYLKMIKKCMSDSHGFVIVLKVNDASEFGISKKGTYVEIVDLIIFQMVFLASLSKLKLKFQLTIYANLKMDYILQISSPR